jgi:predicted MPP superfamily phosphohydrolase
MDAVSFDQLKARMGDAYFGKRMRLQAHHVAVRLEGGGHIYWENIELIPRLLHFVLKYTGFLKRAERNTLAFDVRQIDVPLKRLPGVFDGYRILHLSDLHIDFMHDEGKTLVELLQGLSFDLCVITGDYRFHTSGIYQPVLNGMKQLLPALECKDGIVGILGNHDYLEIVPGLEGMGIRMLLNESLAIERDGERVWIAGVDDPHYYEVHDLNKAMQPIDDDETVVLLAHSPEILKEALQFSADYYLCGHTHGGQVCLPGRIPVITNARCKRRYTSGAWEYHGMKGYTSRGTGSSGLPVRIFCPPEVTLHVLRCEE